jgi:hypothetical protein
MNLMPNKEYYESHKEQVKAQHKEWQLKNPNYNKQYNQTHKKQLMEKRKDYYRTHKEEKNVIVKSIKKK